MGYLSLARRVPEASAVEPRALTWLYDLISYAPPVRSVYRRFVEGALAQGVMHGCGLDLGTGPGRVAVEIARRRPRLRMVGLDLAGHMVEKARRQAARAALDGPGLWPQADGHRLPFADGSFDLVVSSFALHHWDDPLCVLNEIARVLCRPQPAEGRPSGRYYIADVCREVGLLQRLVAYASIPVISLAFGSYLGYGGYYESVRAAYTRDEALALLARSALPPGEVRLNSTGLVWVLTIASKETAGSASVGRDGYEASGL
jgi:ubiquinone/menaquinone biosynthesis C-methylase UbiE